MLSINICMLRLRICMSSLRAGDRDSLHIYVSVALRKSGIMQAAPEISSHRNERNIAIFFLIPQSSVELQTR